VADAEKLDLSPMKLGKEEDEAPSWAERMIRLRDHPELGAFRLAFLEATLRAADIRASKDEAKATKEGATDA
jgi:CRISPR-associated endonuclease/helicase Cas3